MMNRFYRPLQILLLLLLVVFQSHSPYNVQAFAVDQNTLRRCLVEKDVHTVTQFVRGMATQTAGKECMAQLAKGSPWKAVFVLRPSGNAKFLLSTGIQSLDEKQGRLVNTLQVGPLSATFRGTFVMQGQAKMNITFETVQLGLFGVQILPTLNIAQGPLRQAIEKFVRGGKKTTSHQTSFVKRPNVYVWHYVDEHFCVARGSSGSLALWMSEKKQAA